MSDLFGELPLSASVNLGLISHLTGYISFVPRVRFRDHILDRLELDRMPTGQDWHHGYYGDMEKMGGRKRATNGDNQITNP